MISDSLLINILWVTVGAFLLTAFLVPLVKLLAFRIGAVDKPNQRKVHTKVMPRMGGLAIYAAYWVATFLALPADRPLVGAFLGATLLVFVGIVDDMTDMPAKLKLLGQIIAAGIACAGGVRIEFVTGFIGADLLNLAWLSVPVSIIWMVAIINAINLIDGLDGLAAGVSCIAAVSMAIVALQNQDVHMALMAVGLAGAALGFLLYNFHPASIFMGDTGSMFLGYMLAVISIHSASKGLTVVSVFIPILILGVPIFDTLFAIIRRSLAGQPIFEADKAHLHHCLLRMGLSHRNTVLLIYAISAGLSLAALVVNSLTTAKGFLVFVLVLLLVLSGAHRLGILGKANQINQKEQKK